VGVVLFTIGYLPPLNLATALAIRHGIVGMYLR
jgi:hypothetical protein